MTVAKFTQLLSTPGEHILHQQFFAILVCMRAIGPRLPADRFLSSVHVARISVFTIRWRFYTDQRGRRRFQMTRPAVMHQREGNCRMSLEALLRANGLEDAFRMPGDARLSPPDDYDGLRTGFTTRFRIR